MRSTSGPTLVYGALTASYSCAASAPYQLLRSTGVITTSKPTAAALAWICSKSDCSAAVDWLVLTGKRTVSFLPSFSRTPSSPSVHPASSSSFAAASGSVSNRLSSLTAVGSTLASGE